MQCHRQTVISCHGSVVKLDEHSSSPTVNFGSLGLVGYGYRPQAIQTRHPKMGGERNDWGKLLLCTFSSDESGVFLKALVVCCHIMQV